MDDVELERHLRDTIEQVNHNPNPSEQRSYALNRLLLMAQTHLPILRSSHPDYGEALNKTWNWVCRRIHRFNPNTDTLIQDLTKWINSYLKWRIREIINCAPEGVISIEEPMFLDPDGHPLTMGDLLTIDETGEPTLSNTGPTLDTLEWSIRRQQQEERETFVDRLIQYIDTDPENVLISCHVPNHPECNAQYLAKRLLLQQPPSKMAEISRDLDISYQKIPFHWRKNCIPLLRKIADDFSQNL
jgi:hypothetical protein